ncbi:recombinase family protein [Hymenobacter glacieicola]|uniref:recombinase family protein n=1 Tax=Hymenobacter glacieicola TaxID=1562124 RepID=UPI001E57FCFF|nr:recombinase family protein [Hymenobacter glacieicola]
MTRYVAYFRVSTARQGQSGLGLEAQQAAVRTFVGSGAHIVAEFVEIESGRKNTRPQLQAAITRAKQEQAGASRAARGQARPAGPQRGLPRGAHGKSRAL